VASIPYGRQHISEEDIQAVVGALRSDFLTQGSHVPEFEKAFAEYIGCKYAVAVANGTAALHLAALAMEMKPGARAITSPITFAATANCLRYCGAEPHFVDIRRDTLLLDVDLVRKTLREAKSGEFAGILPVDFAGLPCPLDELRAVADEFGLWIVEDACHAPGASVRAKHAWRCGDGKYADAAIFSFHPVKHIACGEGGMITTNSPRIYESLLKLRTHGITKDPGQMQENHGGWYMEMVTLGFNYRLTDFQAALGNSQLKRAEAGLEQRRRLAKRYDEAFAGTRIGTQRVPEGYGHVYHLYVIEVANRKELYDRLKEQGIFAQVHYIPAHLHPYYRERGWKKGDCPNAEDYYEKCLSLPMYPTLQDSEQDFVIQEVLKYAR
jgi:UDP-4-amino-4,6-dideoxy-N-acetyl-beta-L-altrosamine transaminase